MTRDGTMPVIHTDPYAVFLPDDYHERIERDLSSHGMHVSMMDDIDAAIIYGWRDTMMDIALHRHPDMDARHRTVLYLVMGHLDDIHECMSAYIRESPDRAPTAPTDVDIIVSDALRRVVDDLGGNHPLYGDDDYHGSGGGDDWFSFITTYACGYMRGWSAHIKVRVAMEGKEAE